MLDKVWNQYKVGGIRRTERWTCLLFLFLSFSSYFSFILQFDILTEAIDLPSSFLLQTEIDKI